MLLNYRTVWQILGRVLCTEAAFMLLPALVCIIYGESPFHFLAVILLLAAAGGGLLLLKPVNTRIFAKEGFLSVALSWIAMSLFGALPFVFSGEIPNFVDAVFETVSGFTTTGATILTDIEGMSRGCIFWRSLTHWIGGMGVLVFVMAVLPMANSRGMRILRAEMPGPSVGKLVPSIRKTALILYVIYIALTVLETVFLLFGGMSFFDSVIHSMSTAGTGGFSLRTLSVGYYDSAYIDVVVTVFMLLFGVNFNLFFLIVTGKTVIALKSEELRCYLCVVVLSGMIIALNIMHMYGGLLNAMRYSFFQVASIVSTTGFATADFDRWPELSKALLVALMFMGGCAGSTGGSMKVSRVMILFKAVKREITHLLRPHAVTVVKLEGKTVDDSTVSSSFLFFFVYIAVVLTGTVAVALNGADFTTSFTASLSCVANVGPGLAGVGPMGGFAPFSMFTKLLLSLSMLMGRLEIFPMLILFSPQLWRKK